MLRNPSITLCLIIGLAATPCLAAQEEFSQLLDILLKNQSISEKQYDTLMDALDEESSDDEGSAEVQVETQGGLEVSTYDGAFSFELGGRLMIDAVSHQEDQVALGDGTELRRARLEAEGVLFSDWGYELGIDFADGDADVKDAYIAYRGWWPAMVKIGQFKEPFSLEEMTSSKYIAFMERALANEFAPGRSIGLGFQTRGEGWTASTGVFGGAFDDDVDDEGDEGWSLTGRVSYAPWRDDRRALHLGAALSYRTPDDEHEVKYNSRPESHLTDVKYLNTGKIDEVDHVSLAGLEAALVQGPFSVQGEYIQSWVDREGDLENYSFNGWYLYGSWFLTGESRIYKAKKGSFGRINPTTGIGAWELALRYSSLDLTDDSITGGEADQLTLGVNWYVNPHIRFMANYIMVDNDELADDDGDVQGDDDPKIFQLRAQLDF